MTKRRAENTISRLEILKVYIGSSSYSDKILEEYKAVALIKEKKFPLKLHKRDEIELGYEKADDKNMNSASK